MRASARMAAYRRISAHIPDLGRPQRCREVPANKRIRCQAEVGGRPHCHAEGRGFESLQPLFGGPFRFRIFLGPVVVPSLLLAIAIATTLPAVSVGVASGAG